MANTGLGATIAFTGGVTIMGRIRSIGGLHAAVEPLDDTALSSSGFYEAVPDDLATPDPITIEGYWDASINLFSALGTVCTITITGSLQTGQTNPCTLVGTGFVSEVTVAEHTPGTRLMATLQVKFDGKTGPTFTVAS